MFCMFSLCGSNLGGFCFHLDSLDVRLLFLTYSFLISSPTRLHSHSVFVAFPISLSKSLKSRFSDFSLSSNLKHLNCSLVSLWMPNFLGIDLRHIGSRSVQSMPGFI